MGSIPAQTVIGIADKVTGQASLADNIVTLHNSGKERFKLANQWGQTIASFSSAVPVLAPVSFQANTYAATVTFLNIVVELEEGHGLNVGDTVSLVGNVAGIIATVTIMAGTSPVWVPTVASAVAVAAGAYGIFGGENFGKLVNWAGETASNFWPEQPVANLSDYHMDMYGNYRRYDEIPDHEFGAYIMTASSWTSSSAIVPNPKPTHQGVDDPWIDLPQRVIIST